MVAGVRFVSRDGHYFSECGRWAIFHQFRGTSEACWELFEVDAEGLPDDMIDSALTLGEVLLHGDRGWFSLEARELITTSSRRSTDMSSDRVVRYTVEFVVDRPAHWTPSEWRVRARGQAPGYGAPTVENLKKHVAAVEASTQPDGPNAHLGTTRILRAVIVDNQHPSGGKKVVASYIA